MCFVHVCAHVYRSLSPHFILNFMMDTLIMVVACFHQFLVHGTTASKTPQMSRYMHICVVYVFLATSLRAACMGVITKYGVLWRSGMDINVNHKTNTTEHNTQYNVDFKSIFHHTNNSCMNLL